MNSIVNFLGNIVLVVCFVFVTYLGYCLYQNSFNKSTVFINPWINGPTMVMAGDVVEVNYHVIRNKSCKLEISRLVRRQSDQREFQIQFVVQPITADDPPFARPSYYRAQLPPELSSDRYYIFSRVQYFCNVMDYLKTRVTDMPGVEIMVEGIR